MGAWVGSQAHKEKYVSDKVDKWVVDIEELARLANDEPQAVYACYTKAIAQRWSYIQRTVPGISHLFKPLEDCIRGKLIPALIGRKVNELEGPPPHLRSTLFDRGRPCSTTNKVEQGRTRSNKVEQGRTRSDKAKIP